MKKCKYLLLDCNNLLYRAHFATDLTDGKGRPVGGAIGVMKMVGVLIRKFNPEQVIVAWDEGKSLQRLELYPGYKAKRDEKRKPEDKKAIERQKRLCQELFELLPVRQIFVNSVEADDIIGILCEKLKGKKIVVSNDQDFFQLVRRGVSLYLPNHKKLVTVKNGDVVLGKLIAKKIMQGRKNGNKDELVLQLETTGMPIEHHVLFKSMVGDVSDSINGIGGIGEKRASAIILNKGKKPVITEEQQAILDRNKYLISIGALVLPDQMKSIKAIFRKQKGKKFQRKEIQNKFGKLGFRQLYLYFGHWERPFKNL